MIPLKPAWLGTLFPGLPTYLVLRVSKQVIQRVIVIIHVIDHSIEYYEHTLLKADTARLATAQLGKSCRKR